MAAVTKWLEMYGYFVTAPYALQQRTFVMKVNSYIFLCCLGLCLLVFSSSSAVGQGGPVVESVSFHREDARKERVRIKLNGPYTPKIYTMEGENKPRLVIDFAGARYAGLITPVVKGGDSLVKNIRIGVHSEPSLKVRVVLDLEPGRKYTYTKDFHKQENVLNVNFASAAPAKRPEPAVVRIEAGVVKQKVVGGAKKIVALASKKIHPQVAAEPEVKNAPPEKPAKVAPEAVVQPPTEVGNKPAGKSAEAPVAQDTTVEKSESPAQPIVQQTAKPVAKSDEKPLVKPEVKAPAGVVSGAEEETAVKSPEELLLESAGKAMAEEEKKAAEQISVSAVSQKAPEKKAPEQKVPEQKASEQVETPTTPEPLLLDVTYENNSSKGEMVFFHLNGFFPPNVSAVENDSPQVVCDFLDMAQGGKVKPVIEARGAYVQKIETTAGKDPKKIQVTLTLAPHHNYDLRQVFFKEDNLFVLVVNTMDEEKVDQAAGQKK